MLDSFLNEVVIGVRMVRIGDVCSTAMSSGAKFEEERLTLNARRGFPQLID
jgi:hypothetical protein